MGQLLFISNTGTVRTERKSVNSWQVPMKVVIIAPGGYVIYSVYCEEDSDFRSIYRDEMDPDDLTDYGYFQRRQRQERWEWPGYGDDD